MKTYPINRAWDEYYKALEAIRRSGVTNMWGASPYLAKACNITQSLANDVLMSWITNYGELNEIFGWQ